MEDGIEVGLLFRTDAIAAHFAMGDGVQIEGFDDLVRTRVVRQIGLVAQDQERDTFHRRFSQQQMKLFFGHPESVLVG